MKPDIDFLSSLVVQCEPMELSYFRKFVDGMCLLYLMNGFFGPQFFIVGADTSTTAQHILTFVGLHFDSCYFHSESEGVGDVQDVQ